MACQPVITGNQFLLQALAHIDCQAQSLGSFGFQALAQPGSPASIVLTALLTLFIAIYGIRLLFGATTDVQDVTGAGLKVAIVLLLAVSWPAWRILAYQTVLQGPAEIASWIMPSSLVDPGLGFAARLQAIDANISALTVVGSGRQTGDLEGLSTIEGFRSIALQDETALGWSRPIYLASVIGPLGTVRLAAGLLLALAPLMAGLLLFETTRGLFMGWLRGLAMAALGALGLTVVLAVQVTLMAPWLADILNRRSAGYAVPTAPTELLSLVIAFAVATAGLLFLLAKVAFHSVATVYRQQAARLTVPRTERTPVNALGGGGIPVHSRAIAISESVATNIQREQGYVAGQSRERLIDTRTAQAGRVEMGSPALPTPLGSGYRRGISNRLTSHRDRDRRT